MVSRKIKGVYNLCFEIGEMRVLGSAVKSQGYANKKVFISKHQFDWRHETNINLHQ